MMPQVMQKSSKSCSGFYYGKFPSKFKWGSSSSACQVEGGWNLDGKGFSWWDLQSRKNPQSITDGSRADLTADSYHRFEEDVMLLSAMKATCYKFSLSWSRILPDGTLSKVNKSGIEYYNDLINTLLENGIEPIIVLYHWDLPQALFEKYPQSWLDENVIKAFGQYAQLCFKKFGDRVKRWVTIHDPWTHSEAGYGEGIHPPGIQQWKMGTPYKAYRNLLKAHALACKIYDKGFRRKQNGKIGISVNSKCVPSQSVGFNAEKPMDEILAHLSLKNEEIPSYNPNPNCCKNIYGKCNPNKNWLWLEVLKNPFDFIDLNDETISTPRSNLIGLESLTTFSKSQKDIREKSNCSQSSTTEVLNVIKTELGNPEVLICGKGLPLVGNSIRSLVDLDRIEYFKAYANEILKCVVLDECNIIGYLPGTLVDSWEWENGFTISYGLHQVNFNSSEKHRVQRSSAKYLKYVFETNGFSEEWDIGNIPLNPNL